MLHGTPSRTFRSPHAAGHPRATGDKAAADRATGDRATGGTRVAARHRHRVAPRFRSRPLAVATSGVLALPRTAVLLPVSPQWAAQALTKALASLIVVAVFGLIAFFIVADERRDDSPASASAVDPLASRAADPAPLTLQEVFPDPAEVRPPGVTSAYQLTTTHIDSQCATATVGNLGAVLAGRGCSQVVRASLTAPYGDYRVTAGLFNLADAAGAVDVDNVLRGLVETGDGGFATLPAGRTGPDDAPTAQIGWHTRGHYLLYCVINRPDGSVVAADDPYAARITADLVDTYLGTSVLGRRAAEA